MRLLFEQKKPGRVKQNIQPVAIDIDERPTTVGELIAATVKACVRVYNLKAAKAPENPDDDMRHNLVMNEKTINDLAETGRVSFGIVHMGYPNFSSRKISR